MITFDPKRIFKKSIYIPLGIFYWGIPPMSSDTQPSFLSYSGMISLADKRTL